MKFTKMPIGARIIKTGIAVTVTMFVCQVLDLESALFGVVAAVVSMQPSLYLTLTAARNQVLVLILGVVVGLAFGHLAGGNPLTVGAATVAMIFLIKRLGLESGMLMGIVAAIVVLTSAPDRFFSQALDRSAVIFIGLVVAMTVNAVLWSPRHGRRLVDKLRASNEAAVRYFCQAVHDFVQLENQEIPRPEAQQAKVAELIGETRALAEYFRYERKHYFDRYSHNGQEEWFPVAERLMDYNEALTEKADHLYELLPARLGRRLESGAPRVSNEFRFILEVLENGCLTIERVNEKLRFLICDLVAVESEEVSESYWEKLAVAIERWQSKPIDSYCLHTLIEVAVVAGEIRWVSREGKRLLGQAEKCRKHKW
jgi:uncharacterized membrane protein YgaE (UPF0421/DUF939 family)